MKKRIVPADEDGRFREAERSLKASINKIYAKANEITHQKNLLEEEINLLCEKRSALLQNAFLSAAKGDAALIGEIIADATKLERYIDRLSDRKLRKELKKLDSETRARQNAMGRFEVLRNSLETQLRQQLTELYDELNEVTRTFYGRKRALLQNELKALQDQQVHLAGFARKKEEEIRECETALNVKEKPRELFKWW